MQSFSCASAFFFKLKQKEGGKWARKEKQFGPLLMRHLPKARHQTDSCYANPECSMRERIEREKVEKKTDVLFRGTWKKGMGHFVENL